MLLAQLYNTVPFALAMVPAVAEPVPEWQVAFVEEQAPIVIDTGAVIVSVQVTVVQLSCAVSL